MHPIRRNNHTLDASNQSLGRLASRASILLQGKDKPSYRHSADEGGFVTIINAKNITFTGKKFEQKKHYWHSGHPGGLKESKLSFMFQRDPTKVIRQSVYRMLPKNTLREKMIMRLRIYATTQTNK